MRKYFIPGSILMAGCSLFLLFFFTVCQHSFSDFAMELFCHELSGNTINLHYTLTDPEALGIEEALPSFGGFNKAAVEKEVSYLKNCQKQLTHYLNRELKEEELLTAEVLDWWLTGQISSEQFYYYQEPLGPTLGIQAQLPVLLAEFPFRSREDIDTYLKLLTTLPAYFDEIAAFEKEKSEQGLFMNDEILDKILAQCHSLFPINKTHFLVTTFRERLEDCEFLDSDQKISYEVQNLRILNRDVTTAYKNLCRSIEALRGTGINKYGLYHTPKGIEYYESLLRYNIGTDLGMAEIHKLLEEQMESDYETILYAVHQNTDILHIDKDIPSRQKPSDILAKLQKQIQTDFPAPQDVSWQVKEVPDSLTQFLSPAFYMTPAIDAREENTIYINPSYQPNRTELVTTLAHEGYPGHLYQNSFENKGAYHPLRNLFYIGGYTEGWCMYSEFYAYDFLGLSDLEADFLQAMSSLNYAICASLDLAIHGEGWTEENCLAYLSSFGITNAEQTHELYLNILEEPSNYLKYYLGYLEICRLKESALALSSSLTLYDFHKWFLEMGPAPFPILKKHLDALEVSSHLLQRTHQNIHLLAVKPVHNGLNHFPVKPCVLLIGCNSLPRKGEEHHPLVLCAADAGYISLFYQVVNGGG